MHVGSLVEAGGSLSFDIPTTLCFPEDPATARCSFAAAAVAAFRTCTAGTAETADTAGTADTADTVDTVGTLAAAVCSRSYLWAGGRRPPAVPIAVAIAGGWQPDVGAACS